MKAIPLIVVAVMALAASARSQEQETAVSQEGSALPVTEGVPSQPESPTSADPVITDTQNEAAPTVSGQQDKAARTFIPGLLNVPQFTPPVPVPPKVLPRVRVNSSVTFKSKNSRTLTLQRGEPSTAPDLPPPPPPPVLKEPTEPTPEEIARRIWHLRHTINLGATICDHKVSVVNWTDQETLMRYKAVCGFDIGLLAGVGGFVHKGENYSLFLVHGDFDTTIARRFANQWQMSIPEVAPGEIIITEGDPEDTIATAPMSVIKDIIAAEQPRLLAYQAARKTYFAASAAWYAAHPPIPRDQTFILRPHRGSRYLAKPEPRNP